MPCDLEREWRVCTVWVGRCARWEPTSDISPAVLCARGRLLKDLTCEMCVQFHPPYAVSQAVRVTVRTLQSVSCRRNLFCAPRIRGRVDHAPS